MVNLSEVDFFVKGRDGVGFVGKPRTRPAVQAR
jgi:hypothetical protein